MIGSIEAVEYFQSLIPEGDAKGQSALERIKYESARSIGLRVKRMPPPKPGFHETVVCRHCGSGGIEAWWSYCPNCGTKFLKNDYTEKKVMEHQISIEEWLKGAESND